MALKKKKWTGTTFGNEWMHRNLISIIRHTDIRLFYIFSAIFIVPACMIFGSGCRVIYSFFREKKRMGIFHSLLMTYRNHFIFSQVVIDRFAMYAGKHFEFDIVGHDIFKKLSSSSNGFIQFSSHIGNFELAGYSLKSAQKIINAVVFAGEKESIMKYRDSMFAETNMTMIPISNNLSHLFMIDEALQRGEIISMPADRIIGSEKYIENVFLGKTARFPKGPFSIATMRCYDAIAMNVMKSGLKKYCIYIKKLEYDKNAPRVQQIKELSKAYSEELERIINIYPTQWFNYFDFWNQA